MTVRNGAEEQWLIQSTANLICLGRPLSDIAKELNVPYHKIRAINQMPETGELIKARGEQMALEAKSFLRRRIAALAEKTIKVIEQKLDEGELEAAKVALKVLGALEPEPLQAQATNIQVVLPGYKSNTIEVKNEQ